jgi:hypothetical protein
LVEKKLGKQRMPRAKKIFSRATFGTCAIGSLSPCHALGDFLVKVYSGCKFCPCLLETVGIEAPSRNFTNLPLFTVGSSRKSCPSARRASAASNVCEDVDIYKHVVMLKHILKNLLVCVTVAFVSLFSLSAV